MSNITFEQQQQKQHNKRYCSVWNKLKEKKRKKFLNNFNKMTILAVFYWKRILIRNNAKERLFKNWSK